MARFLKKLLAFSGGLVVLCAIGVALPATPRTSTSMIFAKIDKDALLAEPRTPRLILVGGSNLSFGINGALIRDSLGLWPVNTGVHAALGLVYMMDNVVKHIRPGDVVVLAPEYGHFYRRTAYGAEELLRTVFDVDPSSIDELGWDQWVNILPSLPKYAFSKFKPTEYLGTTESLVYSRRSFNEYGDVDAHRDLPRESFRPGLYLRGAFNTDVLDRVQAFEKAVEQRGGRLYVTFPGVQARSVEQSADEIRRVEAELGKHFDVLGSPTRYAFPDSLMYNTAYHLSWEGMNLRTRLLIEDLRAAGVSGAPTLPVSCVNTKCTN